MKKNLAIIVATLSGGGGERVAAELSIALNSKYNVYIVVFERSENEYNYSGNLISLNSPPKKGIGKITNVLNRTVKLWRIKKQYKIDCAISILDSSNLINTLSFGNTIATYHSLRSVANNSFLETMLMKFSLKFSKKVVAVSKIVKTDLVNNFNADSKKIEVVYNIKTSIADSKSTIEKTKGEKDKLSLVTMGSLRTPKGHWHLLKAFKIVHQKYPNSRLIILGEGELKEKLEELSKKLKIDNYVEFKGFIIDPFSIIREADVFVFSSIYEGFGNAIIEALASRKTVVSVDCKAGPREILAPNTNLNLIASDIEYAKYGVLTPPFNPNGIFNEDIKVSKEEEKFAEAVIELLSNKSLRNTYEKHSYERAQMFSSEVISKDWIKIIDSFPDKYL